MEVVSYDLDEAEESDDDEEEDTIMTEQEKVDKKVIYFAFLNNDGASNGFIENLIMGAVSCALTGQTEGIVHVEIVIPIGKNRITYYSSSSVDKDTGKNGVRKRIISSSEDKKGNYKFLNNYHSRNSKFEIRPGYLTFVEVVLTKKQKKNLIKYLDSKEGKGFNSKGWHWNYIPILKHLYTPVQENEKKFTCSELAIYGCMNIGILDKVNPSTTNPHEFFCIILDDKYRKGRFTSREVTIDEMMGNL